MLLAGLFLAVLILAVTPAVAQQTAISIRGRVVAAENDRPLRRAFVSLVPADRVTRPVLTDDDGRFEVTTSNRSPRLFVAKAGYATTAIETPRDRTSNRIVSTREIEVRLPKGAAISGRIADESGAPAMRVAVSAQRTDGTDADRSVSLETTTDDRGEYRIGGLSGGSYIVATAALARGQSDQTRKMLEAMVASGLMSPGAKGVTRTIEIRPGEETGSIDFTGDSYIQGTMGPPPVGRASRAAHIDGRVVSTTGEPVGGALIRLSGSGQIRVTTGAPDGRFRMDQLPDGTYTLDASIRTLEPGAMAINVNDPPQGVSASDMVRVVGGSATRDSVIVLPRGSVITGEIVDEAGEPLQGVRVHVMQLRRENGRMAANNVIGASGRVSDDRGHYRVFGLQPGNYLIVAKMDGVPSATVAARTMTYPPVFYPGTPSIDGAQPLQVSLEAEVSGVNLTVAPSVSARVTGMALDSGGEPLGGTVQLVASQRSGAVAIQPTPMRVGPDGMFEILDVPPGDYVVQVMSGPMFGRPAEFGAESVVVSDGDPPPVTVRTSAGATLEGRFVAEGVPDPPMRALSLHAITTDLDRGLATDRGPALATGRGPALAVHGDGRFYMTGLRGPTKFALLSPPPHWYLKSITIGGVDVTDSGFDFGHAEQTIGDAEVVVSPAGATIAGSVTDPSGAPAAKFVAMAFSTNREQWFSGSRFVKQGVPGGNGSFDIDGLPPGDYWVAAVGNIEPGDWQSPEVLDALVPMATRVSVGEGKVFSTELRLLPRGR